MEEATGHSRDQLCIMSASAVWVGWNNYHCGNRSRGLDQCDDMPGCVAPFSFVHLERGNVSGVVYN